MDAQDAFDRYVAPVGCLLFIAGPAVFLLSFCPVSWFTDDPKVSIPVWWRIAPLVYGGAVWWMGRSVLRRSRRAWLTALGLIGFQGAVSVFTSDEAESEAPVTAGMYVGSLLMLATVVAVLYLLGRKAFVHESGTTSQPKQDPP